jgi:hypothetical protein
MRTMAQGFSCKKISGRDPHGAWRQDELIDVNSQWQSNFDSDLDFRFIHKRTNLQGHVVS